MAYLERDTKLEEIKLDSRIRYNRDRVISGRGPHRILAMIQQKMLERLSKAEIRNEDTDLNESPNHRGKRRR